MIQVQELLYIDAADFFKHIAESVAYDISEATGKKVRVKQLHKGFSYKKTMKNKVGRKGEVDINITEWDPPHIYKAEFSSYGGVNTLSYEIEDLADGRIGVTYSEDFKGRNRSSDWNFKLMNLFYKGRAKKRATRPLRAVEKYAQEEKAKENKIEDNQEA